MGSLTLKFDGAADNNSKFKFMGAGVAVWENGERCEELDFKKMAGSNGTSNIAEWEALIEALKTAHAYTMAIDADVKIRIYGDSQLIIRQFSGRYKVKAPHLKHYHDKAMMYKKLLGSRLRIVEWIPREDNKEADILSKEGITDYLKEVGLI
jgi:ribonuclease HI